jgi:hypothetical protein
MSGSGANNLEDKVAFCGLTCTGCPIHLATIEQDKTKKRMMRDSIAVQMARFYGTKPKVDDIDDCDGCTAETGRLFSGCSKCEIRKCAILQNVKNCAFCNDYACEKLDQIFQHEKRAKDKLDEIRRRINLDSKF